METESESNDYSRRVQTMLNDIVQVSNSAISAGKDKLTTLATKEEVIEAFNVAAKMTADITKQATVATAKATVAFAKQVADDIQHSSRSQLDHEIALIYIEERKYGLEGTNGTVLSNYLQFVRNHHQIFSLCFASKKNPFDRKRHALVLINKISLALLLSTLQSRFSYNVRYGGVDLGASVIISLIIGVYGYILKSAAVCYYCGNKNVAVRPAEVLGISLLVTLGLVSGFMIAISIYLLAVGQAKPLFLKAFIGSTILDFLSPFYLGIWSWILVSWRGCLCLPKFPSCIFCCFGKLCPDGFPSEFCPLLSFVPIAVLLQAIGLGSTTYAEDRAWFRSMYPGRRAVDDVPKLQDGIMDRDVESNDSEKLATGVVFSDQK